MLKVNIQSLTFTVLCSMYLHAAVKRLYVWRPASLCKKSQTFKGSVGFILDSIHCYLFINTDEVKQSEKAVFSLYVPLVS